jgi:hypothetical protein
VALPTRRLGWVLAGIAAAAALASVLVYASTGTFPAGWLLASSVAYGVVLVAAVALAVADRTPALVAATPPAGHPGEPKLVERLVTYRTADGMAVRLTYLWPDGAREIRHVAFTPGESLTLHEIEAQLDAFPPIPQAPEAFEDGVEAALRKHARKEEPA